MLHFDRQCSVLFLHRFDAINSTFEVLKSTFKLKDAESDVLGSPQPVSAKSPNKSDYNT